MQEDKKESKLLERIIMVSLFPVFMVGGFPHLITAKSDFLPFIGVMAAVALFIVFAKTIMEWNKSNNLGG